MEPRCKDSTVQASLIPRSSCVPTQRKVFQLLSNSCSWYRKYVNWCVVMCKSSIPKLSQRYKSCLDVTWHLQTGNLIGLPIFKVCWLSILLENTFFCVGVGTKLCASKAGQWVFKDYISNPNISNHKKHIARDTFEADWQVCARKNEIEVCRQKTKKEKEKEGRRQEKKKIEGSLKQVV